MAIMQQSLFDKTVSKKFDLGFFAEGKDLKIQAA
jgi:hypothetical protein